MITPYQKKLLYYEVTLTYEYKVSEFHFNQPGAFRKVNEICDIHFTDCFLYVLYLEYPYVLLFFYYKHYLLFVLCFKTHPVIELHLQKTSKFKTINCNENSN